MTAVCIRFNTRAGRFWKTLVRDWAVHPWRTQDTRNSADDGVHRPYLRSASRPPHDGAKITAIVPDSEFLLKNEFYLEVLCLATESS